METFQSGPGNRITCPVQEEKKFKVSTRNRKITKQNGADKAS